jgi:parvulin-like peptidyl-prolyl isomerase
MLESITVTKEDIFHQVKLSCQIQMFIEGVVNRKIIENMAQEMGLIPTTEELQESADNLRIMNKLINAEDTFKWLNNLQLSVDNFEEMAAINLMSGKLANHLFAEQVDSYFYEHQLNYTGAILYEVILADEDEAMEIFFELQEGETTFFEIAQEYIENKELKRKGGYLGLVKKTAMKPDISAKVFAANPPQLLKPIVTAKGVHLIKVEEIIKPELTEQLRYQILGELFTDWIKKQVEGVEIIKQLT